MSLQNKVIDEILLNKVAGTFGVEIEAEGVNLPSRDVVAGTNWRRDEDGSLQAGLENAEYVMRVPKDLQGTMADLNELAALYEKQRTRVEETQTSGVHVHVNVQDFKLADLYKLATLYFTLDELVTTYCGPSRQGNHFCLRGIDADNIIFALIESVKNEDLTVLNTDFIRYCTMNFVSLFKYGSIEYRGMRGTSDINSIKRWIHIINNIVNATKLFNSPEDIVTTMSVNGVDNFIQNILGGEAHTFLQVPDRERMIRTGIRLVQPLAYAVDWNKVEKVSSNPFRKAKKKVMVDGVRIDRIDMNHQDWRRVPVPPPQLRGFDHRILAADEEPEE